MKTMRRSLIHLGENRLAAVGTEVILVKVHIGGVELDFLAAAGAGIGDHFALDELVIVVLVLLVRIGEGGAPVRSRSVTPLCGVVFQKEKGSLSKLPVNCSMQRSCP